MFYVPGRVVVIGLVLASLAACGDDGNGGKKRRGGEHLVHAQVINPITYTHTTEHTGSLRAARSTRLFSQEEGRLESITVWEGDRVKKGQLLARLDDRLLQAELGKLVAERKQASYSVRRLERIGGDLASKEQLEKARTELAVAEAEENILKTRLSHTRILSPYDGIVSQRLVEEGDVVARYTHVLSVYDPASLITELTVSELLLTTLRDGDEVDVRIDALGPQRFPGHIARIHPTVDERTRRGLVEVELKPVPEGATAGQLGRVTLKIRREQRMLVPFAALQRDRESEFVFVVSEDNKAKRVPIRTGLRFGDAVEVQGGLEPGSRVVVRGFFGLTPGKPLKVVEGVATEVKSKSGAAASAGGGAGKDKAAGGPASGPAKDNKTGEKATGKPQPDVPDSSTGPATPPQGDKGSGVPAGAATR